MGTFKNIVENMKEQTFGVEVEMNNICRGAAAKLIAEFFGTNRYEYTASRNGYFTWSCWDTQGREWKFQRDVSIAGPDAEKCEMVTPILTYDDIEDLQEIIRQLRHAGAKSDATRGCGVHIHVGANGQTPQSFRNLVNLMASNEDLITEALKLDRHRISQYCRPVDPRLIQQINEKKPSTMTELADVWYGSQNCNYGRNQHYNDSRYHMLNLHATFTKGTVEFRLFQFNRPGRNFKGGLHAGMLKSWIQFSLAICQYAKEMKRVSPDKVQMDNPKYAMAGFLCKMELIGDEFKTMRNIFTRNLEGNTGRRYIA